MHKIRKTLIAATAALATTLALVPTASAEAPEPKTGAATSITSAAATLQGTVDPNGAQTTYYFEYGTTRRYGSRTADATAGRGANPRKVTVRVEGLAANQQYHFRLVASNPSGVRSGANRSFKTRVQPLGLQISAAPNPVVFGAASQIVGTLTGTNNGNRQVVLQSRTFPFTADFTDSGNPVVTDQNGNFTFQLAPLPLSSQFRVRTQGNDPVVSEVLNLGVAAAVTTSVSKKSVRRFKRTRFFGRVNPARSGAPFEIQRRTGSGRWLIVARGFTGDDSRFSKRVRVTRTAQYRVLVHMLDGQLVSGFGPEVAVAVKKRRSNR